MENLLITDGSAGVLKNVSVIEIGNSYAVHLTGMILADQGAKVTRIEEQVENEQEQVYKVIDRLKTSMSINLHNSQDCTTVVDLVKKADILIIDLSSEINSLLKESDLQTVVSCLIKPYNSDFPAPYWREESLGVASGLYETPAGIGKPQFFDLPIISTLGALYAANAVTFGLVGKKRFGGVYNFTLPLQNVGFFTQLIIVMMRTRIPLHWVPLQMLTSPFMGTWKTAGDQFIYVHFGAPGHLRSFMFLLDKIGLQEYKQKIKSVLGKTSRRDPVLVSSAREAFKITGILQNLFLKKTADEWEDIIGGAGLCCTKVRTFEEWAAHPQVLQSEEIREFKSQNGDIFKIPGELFEFHEKNTFTDSSSSTDPARLVSGSSDQNSKPVESNSSCIHPLNGLKVLDLSRIIAGPYSGRIMSEFGAEVIHVYIRPNHLSFEEAFHVAFNSGKDSLVIDYSTPDGKKAFQKLIDTFNPDVIIHNFLDDAANKLGLNYDNLKKKNSKIICIDIKSYNPIGPWGKRPGVEWNIQSTSGIVDAHSTGTVPDTLAVPFNDLATGLIAALGMALALYQQTETGSGNRVSTYLSTSSILLQIDKLNAQTSRNSDRFISYFKAADCWFLLSAKRQDLALLARLPEFSKLPPSSDLFDNHSFTSIFRKKEFNHWKNSIETCNLQDKILLHAQKPVKTLVTDELKKGERDSFFLYKEHECYGKLLCAKPPIKMKSVDLIDPSPAKYFGSSNPKWLKKEWFENPILEVKRPSLKDDSFIRRVGWAVSQFKWLGVAVYKKLLLKRGN